MLTANVFLLHVFLTLFEAITLSLDVNNGGVMQDAVKDGGSNGNVSKDLVPL